MTFQSHFDFGPLSDEGNRIPLTTRAHFALRRAFRRIRDLTLFFGGGDVEEAQTVPRTETSSLRVGDQDDLKRSEPNRYTSNPLFYQICLDLF
jgi:hypothetical protein